MSDIHDVKVRWLQDNKGMEQIGVVLAHPTQADRDIAIVAGAAVRWLSKKEFHAFMHPRENGR